MKRVVIILLLITILVSLITATMIIKKRIQIAKNETDILIVEEVPTRKVTLYKEYHLPINDDTKGATLAQTFDINPIKFTEHIYEDDKTYAIYLQIDGLKNEKIEEAINAELKSQIIDFGRFAYDEIIKADKDNIYTGLGKYNKDKEYYSYNENPSNWNSCVREKVTFNGNNAISIAITDYRNEYLTRYSNIPVRFLNYNLVNGEKIKIEELFTKEYSVTEAFARELYYHLGEGEIKWNDNYHYNEITGEQEWWRI